MDKIKILIVDDHALLRDGIRALLGVHDEIEIVGEASEGDEAISSKDRPRGLGLLGMKERVELVNGTLNIRSHPGGGGTEIDIEIPLSWEVSNG